MLFSLIDVHPCVYCRQVKTEHADQLFVVPLRRVHRIAAVQPCFTFHHPSKDESLERTALLEFSCTVETQITALACYFASTFFKHIRIDSLPGRGNYGSSSWFPAILPLRAPIRCPSGSVIKVRINRRLKELATWYEWQVFVLKVGDSNVNYSISITIAGQHCDPRIAASEPQRHQQPHQFAVA